MGTAFTQAKPFASLGPMLLARKGTAKPAMRAMLCQDDRMAELSDELDELASSQSALGWNDMGEDWDHEDDTVVALPLAADRMNAAALQQAKGRTRARKAFTLRLDAERHLKLRLAGTMHGCSAQALVTAALDRFLADHPEIDAIAAEMARGTKQS
ncbi:hypothetical protein GRI62_01885 [Erythrobacter arachoides]|uniref:Uncharacterized protein n=1 Tax=Aurantiacibacter arachoides TaxID=1850444 RepID=A0A844ZWU4_9SPHN|nr:hypothetical protein [Aurantiacibacter arachoides]MXO92355.1 hypothetical protein [Aurantiacibacter arachoides]GGD57829.1 hypothetical protein GCM10011411_17340 [Aurantiacibacter arachoides]